MEENKQPEKKKRTTHMPRLDQDDVLKSLVRYPNSRLISSKTPLGVSCFRLLDSKNNPIHPAIKNVVVRTLQTKGYITYAGNSFILIPDALPTNKLKKEYEANLALLNKRRSILDTIKAFITKITGGR